MTPAPGNYEQRAKRQAIREQRTRRDMLSVLNEERGNGFDGWVTARYVFEVLQSSLMQDAAPDSDDHCSDLLQDLVNGGYAESRDDREYSSQPFRLDTISYRVTSKGTALLAMAIDPDPLIADPRPRK